jgi:meiotic recombination protein SPO11
MSGYSDSDEEDVPSLNEPLAPTSRSKRSVARKAVNYADGESDDSFEDVATPATKRKLSGSKSGPTAKSSSVSAKSKSSKTGSLQKVVKQAKRLKSGKSSGNASNPDRDVEDDSQGFDDDDLDATLAEEGGGAIEDSDDDSDNPFMKRKLKKLTTAPLAKSKPAFARLRAASSSSVSKKPANASHAKSISSTPALRKKPASSAPSGFGDESESSGEMFGAGSDKESGSSQSISSSEEHTSDGSEYYDSDDGIRVTSRASRGESVVKTALAKTKQNARSATPKSSSAPRAQTARIPDADVVLKPVRDARRELVEDMGKQGYMQVTEEDLEGIVEVADLGEREVSVRIEDLVVNIVGQILNGTTGFELEIPTRAASNQRYLPSIDRIVLGSKTSKRAFLNTAHVRKAAITTRVVELVHEVLSKGIHITKRDLFYTDVKLFRDQKESDSVLDDVACMIGCTRTSLHVVASDKGLVVGRIQYKEAGDEIDCTKMGIGGKAIPPYIDKITDIRSDAEFIILVEKEAAYMRLAEDRFYNKYKCIVITGKGQPDVATRLFLHKIREQLKIPVLALVDSDPYGLKILSVYCTGSKSMSYDSSNLTTPDIKWLGVRPSDLDKYNLPAQCRLPMTEQDRKMGEELLKEDFVLKHPEWVEEVKLMLRTGEKAEIQALSSFGFQYITEQFLPRKLQEGDWI